MRLATIMLSAGLAAGLLTGCGGKDAKEAPAAKVDKPARKAGLWEETSTMAGAPPQLIRICAGPTVESSLPWWGRVAQDGSCKDISGKKNADGAWSFEARCDMGAAGKSGITGTGTGDFESKYEVKVRMNTAGAGNPQLNGPRDLTNSFVWKGECPAGWDLGDVEVSGGMRMNYDPNQVAAEIAKAQAALKAQAADAPPAK